MKFLDDWDKKNTQTQKRAGVQSASLPAAQKSTVNAPLTLTKNGVFMADGKGGGKLITPSLGTKAAAAPIVKPKAAQSAGKQLVNSGTMISDTGSNKRQASPVTPQRSKAQQTVDNLPNIKAFGAGDYTAAGKTMQRAAKAVKAGALSTAGSFTELAAQATPVTGEQHLGQFSGFGDLGRAVRESREKGGSIEEITQRLEQERRDRREKQRQATFDTATRLFEKSAQAQEQAKEGAGTVGRFLVDMGVTGTQMAGDALMNLALPGSGLAMMGMRSYGQAANEARQQGKSEEQQFVAGLKSAGIETFTEKMFGAFSKIYGKAGADELVEKLVNRLTQNKTGQAVLTWLIDGVGEGVEEVTSDVLNPLADRVLKLDDGSGPLFSTDDVAEMGYDFLLGAAMGIVGGTGQLYGGVKQGRAQTAENAYYSDLQQNGLFSSTGTEKAQQARDAMGRAMPREYLQVPRLVDANGLTYEERQAAQQGGVRYAQIPRLVDANGMDAQQRTAWRGALAQMPVEQRTQFETAARIAKRFGATVQAQTLPAGVQGSYQNGVISLNTAATDPVRQVLVHELTHHMETSGLYSRFSDAALQFVAEDMGADVEDLRRAVMADYAASGVTLDEDGATREIVAKFAEEKLFTDEATVQRLLAQDRSLFQRIYDWLRDTVAKLKGTQEQRRLIDAQNLYEKALRQVEAGTQGRGAQYSVAMTRDGYAVAVVNDDILSHIDTDTWDNAKKEQAKKAAKEALSAYSSGIRVDGVDYKVNRTSRREYTRSNDTERLYNRERNIFEDKMRAASGAEDIITATRDWTVDGGLNHQRKDNFVDFAHGKVLLQAGKKQYEARTVVGITVAGEHVLYDVVDMTPTYFEIERELPTTAVGQQAESDIQGSSVPNSIPISDGNVNTEKFSTGRSIEEMAGVDRAAQEKREAREAEGLKMPETLRKIGVEPFGSEADYLGAEELALQASENERARRRFKKEVAKIPASEKEKLFARQLAEGAISWGDVPQTMDRSKVEILSDYYRAMDTGTESQLLRDRRNLIFQREEEKMPSLLGMDVRYDEGGLRENGTPSGRIARQTSTLRRNLQTPARVCATEWGREHGKRVYETLFQPVTENNGRQIDWVNSMLDRVRTFKGTDGKARELNRTERDLVQRLVETRAAEDRVKQFGKQYAPAAGNVRNGWSAADAAKEFGIDKSQQEYRDLENYAAYLDAKKQVQTTAGIDPAVVDEAVKTYSGLYRELYEGINTFLAAHGYKPIGFIEGYAPHIQPEETKTAFSKALKMLGLDDTAMMLPTSISGMTADLKPYKQYNPFFQTRHGDKTEYDIAKGFENYVYYLGNIFYHTDDIMRIRTAAKYIRKTYTSEEASEQISWAENARNFDDANVEEFLRFNGIIKKGTQLEPGDARTILNDYIDGLYEQIGDVSRYSEMVKYLDNYANRLAGKQNMLDRGAEAAAGRRSLNWVNTLAGKYGGAKLAFNVSSALNQTSQLPMVAVENGEVTTAKAIRDFFTKERGDFVQRSNFLKGKKGVDWLLGPETGWEKFKEKGFAMTEAVDSFTSYVAVRSKYLKEKRLGASDAEAMKAADEYGRNVMGSRARGEKPVLFDTKNPFWQIATRFQLEAMNSWEHITRDLPAEYRQMAAEKGRAAAMGKLGGQAARYVLWSFLINYGIGELSGGSPVPYDILGTVAEAVGAAMGLTGSETIKTLLDNVLQAVFDERLFGTDEPDDDEDKDWWAALESFFGNAANDVPILGRAAALAGIGDQTLPTADFSKLGDLADSIKENGLVSGDTLDKALTAGGEFLYGGNQLRKTAQGTIAAARGGVYSKGKLRYPVDRSPWNVGKAVLFGRGALDETQEYYARQAKQFSEKQTTAWEKLQEAGGPAKTAQEQRQLAKDGYDLIQKLRSIEKENEDDNRAAMQRQALREADVSDDVKAVVWYETMASEKDQETLDMLNDADRSKAALAMMDMKDVEKEDDEDNCAAMKRQILRKADIGDDAKAVVWYETLASEKDQKAMDALKGADKGEAARVMMDMKDSEKAGEKLRIIMSSSLTDEQKGILYLNTLAGDEDKEKIEVLEDAYMDAYQYLAYKTAISGLSGRFEKLNAINTLDLTNYQKDALYYMNGWSEKTHAAAPWVQGVSAEASSNRLALAVAHRESQPEQTPQWQQGLEDYLGIYEQRRQALIAYHRGQQATSGQGDIYERRRQAMIAYHRGKKG